MCVAEIRSFCLTYSLSQGFLDGISGEELPVNAGDIRDPSSIHGAEDPLEEGKKTYSNILAW